jgi:hypothetical protein
MLWRSPTKHAHNMLTSSVPVCCDGLQNIRQNVSVLMFVCFLVQWYIKSKSIKRNRDIVSKIGMDASAPQKAYSVYNDHNANSFPY